jgi:hypothetical protein
MRFDTCEIGNNMNEVAAYGTAVVLKTLKSPNMRKQKVGSAFQAHIPEPRWQQIVSVLGIVLILLIWLYFAFLHK